MDRILRPCLQLGLNVPTDVICQVSMDQHEPMASILELIRLTGMTNRHVQLLQTMRTSSLSELTKFEWIYCRLFLNDINEVLEYIDFSKQLDGYAGLDEISYLLRSIESPNKVKNKSERGISDITLMHRESAESSEIPITCENIYEMQELSVSIQSQFFDN